MDEGVQDIQAEAKIGLSALLKTRKLFIPRFDKNEKNAKNAEARVVTHFDFASLLTRVGIVPYLLHEALKQAAERREPKSG